MDKTYILKCDCEEIQGQWKPQEGDYIAERVFDEVYINLLREDAFGELTTGSYEDEDAGSGEPVIRYATMARGAIWLPTQSQLQEMSGLNWHTFDELCWTLSFEYGGIPKESKEQAGLKAVMKTRYSKIWDGREWLKDSWAKI